MYTDAVLDESSHSQSEMDDSEESTDVGSFNHGYLLIRLGILLDRLDADTAGGDVSLDVSTVDLSKFDLKTREEIKPDVCLYPKRGLLQPKDILKMKEMPLLAVEILSPKQGLYDIVEKFRLYFALGIRSCWLVEPVLQTVTVYATSDQWRVFAAGDVVDETLQIQLALDELFI
jgi:Uma2 family endonuclease